MSKTRLKREGERQATFRPERHWYLEPTDGFTLIETMIALSLVAVLMAVVLTMFSVYTQLEQKGVAAAQEVAILRALHGQMRDDLAQIVPYHSDRAPMTIDPQSDAEATDDLFVENGFFIGTENEIHFVVVERSDLSRPALAKVVSYQPISNSPRDRAETESNERIDSAPEQNLGETQTGMERRKQSFSQFSRQQERNAQMNGIAMAGRQLELDADDFLQVGPTTLSREFTPADVEITMEQVDAIPEVNRYRFRFFDGTQWSSEWESTLTGRLPLAIEFQLELETVERKSSDGQESGDRKLSGASSRAGTQNLQLQEQIPSSTRTPINVPTSNSRTTGSFTTQPTTESEMLDDRLTHRLLITITTVSASGDLEQRLPNTQERFIQWNALP